MSNFGDGILKSIDAVSEGLDKIQSQMEGIAKASEDVASGADKAARKVKTASNGTSLGSGSSLFSTNATFSGESGEGAPPSSGGGGFSLNQWANRHPVMMGAAKVALGGAAMAWDMLPGTSEALGQRQAMFGATSGFGHRMPNYTDLRNNMREGFGGFATSTNSWENVASYMAGFGMTMREGANTSFQNHQNFMGQTSAMSLLTGVSNEQAARAGVSIARGPVSNQLYMMGISTTNEDGSPKDFGSTVKQVMDRSFKGKYSLSDVEEGLSPGGILRTNLTQMYGAEGAEMAAQYAKTIAAHGIQDGIINPELMKQEGLTDTLRNPNARQSQTTATHADTVAKYADDLIKGWDLALSAADKLEQLLQQLHGVLAPLANLKGFAEGFAGTHTGEAATTGIGNVASGALSMLGGLFAGAAGSKAVGALGKVAKGGKGLLSKAGGALKSGASLLGRVGARAIPVAGAVLGGAGLTNLAINAWGSDDDSSDTRKVLSSIGRLGGHAATGAAAGAFLGPVGAAVGGGIGLAGGFINMLARGENFHTYGAKENATTGGLFGALGYGSVAGDSRDGRTTADKEGSTGGPSVRQALSYAQRAHASKRANWKNLCQRFVANCYGFPRGVYNSASEAWRRIPKQFKHPGERNAPAGALYYWTGGSSGYGHVALSMGDGTMACNDASGRIMIRPNSYMFNYYGRLQFQGWADPYFGRLVTSLGRPGGNPTGEVDVDGGGRSTGSRSMDTTGGTNGMSATSVSAWSSNMISANAYGGIAAGVYSIADGVASTIEGLMSGGGILSGGSQTSEHSTSSQMYGDEIDGGERGTSRGAGFTVTSEPVKGKGVMRWRNVALNAMRAAGLPDKYFPLLMERMQMESSGNPNAINRTDANAKRGTPSVGLMQVIKPTFESFAGPYKDRGQADPFANIYAAIKWSLHKYGLDGIPARWSSSNKKGYSEGSWRTKTEVAQIHEGEMILPSNIAEKVRDVIRKEGAGQKSGGGGVRKVEVTLNLSGDVEYDARKLARRVKEIWEEEDEMNTIRSA